MGTKQLGIPWTERDTFKEDVRRRLSDKLNLEDFQELPEVQRRDKIRDLLVPFVDGRDDREVVLGELLDEVLGLGPLEPLLKDPAVSDILVNGPNEVFIERAGVLEETDVRFRDVKQLSETVDRIAARVGRRIDDSSPLLDARLVDGSRVNAIIPPLALKGPTVSIRRFGAKPLQLDDLLGLNALTPEMASLLQSCVKARLNIIISGGTGSGKTTLLNILSSFIPENERIVTIEDAAELQLQQRHVVPLETRPANLDGKGEITMRHLVRNALRMRPDRIVVGECRGAEALDMLQAMNTGHDGSLTTLHANNTRDGLTRIETMLMMGGFENLPIKAMRRQMVSAINVLVHVERLTGGPRRVTEITEVVGMEGDIVTTQEIFVYRRTGVSPEGRTTGQFATTGVRPKFAVRLKAIGIELGPDTFRERVLLTDQ